MMQTHTSTHFLTLLFLNSGSSGINAPLDCSIEKELAHKRSAFRDISEDGSYCILPFSRNLEKGDGLGRWELDFKREVPRFFSTNRVRKILLKHTPSVGHMTKTSYIEPPSSHPTSHTSLQQSLLKIKWHQYWPILISIYVLVIHFTTPPPPPPLTWTAYKIFPVPSSSDCMLLWWHPGTAV